jgi:D-serine deaminase-like pyridoxal phosphate-dependent protein
MHISELDTPVVTIDLDIVERNIATTERYFAEHKIRSRPHIKTHKLPILAHKQIAAGACGITVQKLGEAEVMAAAGIDDILVTYNILGPQKLERLTRLCRQAKMAVIADSETTIAGLSGAASADGVTIRVLVEMDTGGNRVGVQTPAEAVRLAETIARSPGLEFGGLMTYPTSDRARTTFEETIQLLERVGLQAETRSGGGSPNRFRAHEWAPTVNEHRAGTYIYNDATLVLGGNATWDDCAMRILATVVSRPTADRAIIDGGSKTFTNDHPCAEGYGHFLEYPEAVMSAQSEEHGHVDISKCSRKPEVGERVTVIPRHACGTTNLHDEVVAHRGGRVEAIWPVLARGKIR